MGACIAELGDKSRALQPEIDRLSSEAFSRSRELITEGVNPNDAFIIANGGPRDALIEVQDAILDESDVLWDRMLAMPINSLAEVALLARTFKARHYHHYWGEDDREWGVLQVSRLIDRLVRAAREAANA